MTPLLYSSLNLESQFLLVYFIPTWEQDSHCKNSWHIFVPLRIISLDVIRINWLLSRINIFTGEKIYTFFRVIILFIADTPVCQMKIGRKDFFHICEKGVWRVGSMGEWFSSSLLHNNVTKVIQFWVWATKFLLTTSQQLKQNKKKVQTIKGLKKETLELNYDPK